MTVTSPVAKVVHVTNGALAAYSFPFKVFKAEELTVCVVDASFRVMPLSLGADFTAAGLGRDQGGTITLTVAGQDKAGTGLDLVILRQMNFVQETDYQANDLFPAETHEKALDILTMICQELLEKSNRALIAPPNLDEPIDYSELAGLKAAAEEGADRAENAADRAEAGAARAETVTRELHGLSIAVVDAPRGQVASGSYNSETGMLTLRVPEGKPGKPGAQMPISDSVTSPDHGVAASSFAVKKAFDKAVSASASGFPFVGCTIMFQGYAKDIAPGWYLCNGENGTPDLRKRFIVGAGGDLEIGATGGSDSIEIALAGLTTGPHTLTEAEIPSHRHGLRNGSGSLVNVGAQSSGLAGVSNASPDFIEAHNGKYIMDATGGGGSHTHPLLSSQATAKGSNLPPYYALAFIQFKGV
jgi:hypothetical protein